LLNFCHFLPHATVTNGAIIVQNPIRVPLKITNDKTFVFANHTINHANFKRFHKKQPKWPRIMGIETLGRIIYNFLKRGEILNKNFLRSAFFFQLIFCIFTQISWGDGKINQKLSKNNNQIEQEIDGFLEIALLREVPVHMQEVNAVAATVPFEWPVSINLIRQVLFFEPNKVQIDLKQKAEVKVVHKGMVIAVNPSEKYVWIQHVVEGGLCYISVLENVENLKLKLGDVVCSGDKIGISGFVPGKGFHIILQIIKPHCNSKTDQKPNIQILFPALHANLVKIVRNINCSKCGQNSQEIDDADKKISVCLKNCSL